MTWYANVPKMWDAKTAPDERPWSAIGGSITRKFTVHLWKIHPFTLKSERVHGILIFCGFLVNSLDGSISQEFQVSPSQDTSPSQTRWRDRSLINSWNPLKRQADFFADRLSHMKFRWAWICTWKTSLQPSQPNEVLHQISSGVCVMLIMIEVVFDLSSLQGFEHQQGLSEAIYTRKTHTWFILKPRLKWIGFAREKVKPREQTHVE